MANDLSMEFGISGNGADYRGTGWSEAETTGIWMLGQQSLLVLTRPEARGDYRLELDIGALTGPGHPSQRLSVGVNGTVVAEFALADDVVEHCVLPWSVIGREPGLTLVLSHPDAWRPAELSGGEGDQREMSFFLRSARLSLHEAVPAPAPAGVATGAGAAAPRPVPPAAAAMPASPAGVAPVRAMPPASTSAVPAPAAAKAPAPASPVSTSPAPAPASPKAAPTPGAAAPVAPRPSAPAPSARTSPAPSLPAAHAPAPKPAAAPMPAATPPVASAPRPAAAASAVPRVATPTPEARVPWWKKLLG